MAYYRSSAAHAAEADDGRWDGVEGEFGDRFEGGFEGGRR